MTRRTRRPPANAGIVKRLDALCRAITFARDGHRCRRCGSPARIQWHHINSRSIRVLRWDVNNCLTLCAGCHLWWHHRPFAATDWARSALGQRAIDLLHARMRDRASSADEVLANLTVVARSMGIEI